MRQLDQPMDIVAKSQDEADGPARGHRLLTARSAVLLGLILIVGAALRLSLDAHAPAFIVRGDSGTYFNPAYDWLHQGKFALESKRAPLYPLFLAGSIATLGPSLEAAARVQHLLGLGTVVLVYLLGAHSFGRGTGLLAAFLTAIDGSVLFFEHTIASEVLYAPLLLVGLGASIGALRTGQPALFLLAGCVLGLGALTRPVSQICLPLVCGIVVLQRWPVRPRVLAIALVTVGYLVPTAPWTLYNAARGVVGTGGGLSDALFERVRRHDSGFQYRDLEATGDQSERTRIRQRTFELAQRYDRADLVRAGLKRELGLERAEGEAALRDAAIQVIKQEPGRYLTGTVAMFGQLLVGPGWDRSLEEYWENRFNSDQLSAFPRPVRTTDRASLPTSAEDRARMAWLIELYRDYRLGPLLGLLVLLGGLRCLAAGRNDGAVLLPIVLTVQLLIYAALDGPLDRYRAAFLPLITLLAAGGLSLLLARGAAVLRRSV